MLIEPARNLKETIKLPLKGEQNLTFSNNYKVSQMLQTLHDTKMLSKPVRDYYVLQGDVELDLDLPIHVYNIEKGVLQVLPATFGLHIVDERGSKLYITVNTKIDTILDVKKKIATNSKDRGKVENPMYIEAWLGIA